MAIQREAGASVAKRVCIPVRKGAVALLGAGFSRSVGLPLMSELLERSVPPDMIELVRYLGGFGADRKIGIEEFLTVSDFEDSIRLGGREKNYSYISSFAADIARSMFDSGTKCSNMAYSAPAIPVTAPDSTNTRILKWRVS